MRGVGWVLILVYILSRLFIVTPAIEWALTGIDLAHEYGKTEFIPFANSIIRQAANIAIDKVRQKCGDCPDETLWDSNAERGLLSDSKAFQRLAKRCHNQKELENQISCTGLNYERFPESDSEAFNLERMSDLAQYAAVIDTASVTRSSYGNVRKSVGRIGGGRFVRDNIMIDSHGFYAVTYLDKENRDAIIAFRGTDFDELDDLITDLQTFFSYFELPKQFKKIREHVSIELGRLRDSGYRVILTGHSLGGALAEYAHQLYGAKSYYLLSDRCPGGGD